MRVANSAPFLSSSISQYPRIAPASTQKLKLMERLREALRPRHFLASNLLEDGYDIQTVQELLGHKDVKTTMIYSLREYSVRIPGQTSLSIPQRPDVLLLVK